MSAKVGDVIAILGVSFEILAISTVQNDDGTSVQVINYKKI